MLVILFNCSLVGSPRSSPPCSDGLQLPSFNKLSHNQELHFAPSISFVILSHDGSIHRCYSREKFRKFFEHSHWWNIWVQSFSTPFRYLFQFKHVNLSWAEVVFLLLPPQLILWRIQNAIFYSQLKLFCIAFTKLVAIMAVSGKY